MTRVPTIGELRRECTWIWINCHGRNCSHSRPMALAPLIIRWGPDASSDMIRRNARCERCGGRGATIQGPSWGGQTLPELPFPVRFSA